MKLIRYDNSPNFFNDWDSFFADPFRAFAPLFRSASSSASERPRHAVEWYEDDKSYHARVELPGVKKKDLRIDAEDGLLRFGYEFADRSAEGEDRATRSERFEQVLRCPEGVEVAKIVARLRDGVLELDLPKAEKEKSVSVKIQ